MVKITVATAATPTEKGWPHLEGRTIEVWESSKSFFWLEGTGPTGWGGYTSRMKNFWF